LPFKGKSKTYQFFCMPKSVLRFDQKGILNLNLTVERSTSWVDHFDPKERGEIAEDQKGESEVLFQA